MVARAKKPAKPSAEADDLFKALADPSRRKMLSLLSIEELPLHRIEAQFQMSRPAIIKHMRVLKACRLVQVRKNGRQTIHSLNPEPLGAIKEWMARLDMRWDDHLQRLKRQIESEP